MSKTKKKDVRIHFRACAYNYIPLLDSASGFAAIDAFREKFGDALGKGAEYCIDPETSVISVHAEIDDISVLQGISVPEYNLIGIIVNGKRIQ